MRGRKGVPFQFSSRFLNHPLIFIFSPPKIPSPPCCSSCNPDTQGPRAARQPPALSWPRPGPQSEAGPSPSPAGPEGSLLASAQASLFLISAALSQAEKHT
ncbi:unnamed protein product [Pipistrellus nathusii]|uniref:Uncharacterized protein n=1 Tax=Pipistrellus nathusii TaxID=59473 RepID=A0ABN9Z2A5_PIPNA